MKLMTALNPLELPIHPRMPITDSVPNTNHTVYHYCSVDAARCILSRRVLWMTHISYLNDAAELTYAVDSMRQMLLAIRPDATNDCMIQRLIRRLGDLTAATHYVASFSASGDKLSQWRSYASDGTGVAIGFSLPEWTVNDDGPFVFKVGPVKYGVKGLNQEVATLHERFSEGAHRWERPVTDSEREFSYEMTAHWLADEISKSAAFRKHPGFCEEKEWRWTLMYDFGDSRDEQGTDAGEDRENLKEGIAQSVIKDLRTQYKKRLCFREGKYGLTPYIEFNFRNYGIRVKEVVLGPRTLEHVTKPAFELLRQSHEYDFAIRRSEIPYR